MAKIELTSLGNKSVGEAIFERYFAASAAYRDFLGQKPTDFSSLPTITKSDFYSKHEWEALLPKENFADMYAVLRSSGSSSKDGQQRGFFWPKLKSRDRAAGMANQGLLVKMLGLDRRRTLCIVGLSLGSWAGGEEFSFLFKSIALSTELPLVVFSPGNQHQEILEIIDRFGQHYDQILISLCPSAIFYLERLADSAGIKLPREKILFLATGEPFPEALRVNLQAKGYAKALDCPPLLSAYGSADTGFLGFESQALVLFRQALGSNNALAAAFDFPSSLPNFFHANAFEAYFECVNEEMIVTQWQGIPLVRYNLKDRVRFLSWKDSMLKLASLDAARAAVWQNLAQQPLPDIISVSGRTEGCVFLCGSNIFESMVQDMVLQSELGRICSGTFVAWTSMEDGQQVLQLQLELKPDEAPPSAAALERIYRECVEILGRVQPEFADDYEKFYKPYESQGRQVLRFHFVESPLLSEHPRFTNAVKHRIFIDKGPL